MCGWTKKAHRKKWLLHKALPGFALLESCIALIILGVLVGLALPLMRTVIHDRQAQKTHHQMTTAMRLLADYAYQEHLLPCPADPRAVGALAGVARSTCANGEAAVGIVPYKTLGCDADVALDGYGNFMTYAAPHTPQQKASVRHQLARGGGKIRGGSVGGSTHMSLGDHKPGGNPNSGVRRHPFCAMDGSKSPLAIITRQWRGVPHVMESIAPAAVVLISHGPSGAGAFVQTGRRKPVPSNLYDHDKRQNAGEGGHMGELQFVKKPISKRAKGAYDDVVLWASHRTLFPQYLGRSCTV